MNERRRKRIEKNILKNRKYKTLIYNRVILTVALVLLQIVLYGILVAQFYTSGWTVLMAVEAKMPTSKAPVRPPMPCARNTSNASSNLKCDWMPLA